MISPIAYTTKAEIHLIGVCVRMCVWGGGWVLKDMKTGKQCTEEVVQCHYKRVCPLLAEVDLEAWVLLWVPGEGKSCVYARCM